MTQKNVTKQSMNAEGVAIVEQNTAIDSDTKETSPLLQSSTTPLYFGDYTIFQDALDTIHLAFPIFLSQLSWVGMKTTDSALLGHVSSEALAAAALSDLWTMCSGVFLRGRVLGILVGQAVGAGNPKLAGIYLQVSYFVLCMVAVLVFLLWNVTGQVWILFGSDPIISRDAGCYARVLAWSIPGLVALEQLAQYFSAQRIMHPEVHASSAAMLLNLLLGLIFVLGIPIPHFDGYGFPACPIVTATVIYLQLMIVFVVYVYWKQLHCTCWGGWSWSEITRERIRTFSGLYFPAALGSASDYWRVAVIGAIAAKLGEEKVAVFNTSYRVMWIVLVMVNALSMATSIKISRRLGSMNPNGAKQAGDVGMSLSLVVLLVVGGLVLSHIRVVGRLFTEDGTFLSLWEECRWPFSLTLLFMNFAVAVEKIPYAMGRTTEIFWMGFVASWFAQVPAVVLLTTYWRDDLIGLYTGMAVGYGVLVLLYSAIAFTSDWKKYAELARARSEASV